MTRWGDDKTLFFVTHYKGHDCLWNTRSPLYKNNVARNNAYEALLNVMNDPRLNIKIIKTKIKNLRSVYHSEVKKIHRSKRPGADAAEIYKPPMAWFAEMASFLGDSDDYRATVRPEAESDATSQNSQSDNGDYSSIIKTPPASPIVQTEEDQLPSSSEFSIKRRRVIKTEESAEVVEATNHFENIPSSSTIRNDEDEFHFFGLNVASQLRTLPLYEALDVQTKIQKILTSARRRSTCPNISAITYSTFST